VATSGDLLNRGLLVTLRAIDKSERRPERDIYAELEVIRAKTLGYLCDAVSAGLQKINTIDPTHLPRMADFAAWGLATEAALGGAKGSFLRAYAASEEEGVSQALESAPLAGPLWEFAKGHIGEKKAWTGTAKELLDELNNEVADEVKRSKGWPQAANSLSRQLKRLAPPLLEVGVHVEQMPRSGEKGAKQWRVFVALEEDPGEDKNKVSEEEEYVSSEPSEPSEGAENPHRNGESSTDDILPSNVNTVSTDDIVSSTVDTVFNTVSSENRTDKPNAEASDDTDDPDGTYQPTPENEKLDDDDWTEI
jgi:hypothetical protein